MLEFLRRKRLRRENEDEKALLHISDTPERTYPPRIAQLIDELHPDYIVHTGDLVDNIKLERRPDLKPPLYVGGVRKLARILKGSGGAELYIVPGNEDDPEVLKEYFEGSVVEPGTVVEIEGG
ncbi:metallophosphoesterase [Thermococcus sp. JCM 11816]|uniref:metallophosphoesterase n=1 Tax=Thermococcus sp. (strain JCM 11816 / KS-1) TaxID=1295125 RepID=UPI000A501E40